MNDLTLIEKIQSEQAQTAADLQKFLESEKQAATEDIEILQKKQVEISEVIQKIANKNE
jgi:hypothetical protein